ncbi:MAG: glycosyltransferase family 39 protein [Aquificaceae bacterium]|nr:glycosyltransferase family 39 protein [Aquificaceae bacterium]
MTHLLLFNLALTVFRILYVLFYPLDLTPEEAQYWDWSRHLDLSYYSKPPMVAYMNYAATKILGVSELAVRITPIILSFLLSVLTYLFIKKVFDKRSALIMATLPQITAGLGINSVLMTTDAPFVFFWSLTVMALFLAFEKNTLSLWLMAGILAGLAFLSKYPAVFLLPCAILFGALYKRDVLKSYKPYVSLLPAFLLSLPVLYWNYRHDFVSLKHVSALASKSASLLDIKGFLEFLGGQALLLSVLPFLLLPLVWIRGLKSRRTGFFVAFSLPVFLFFALLSLFKRVEANWSGFGYFGAFVLISLHLSKSRLLGPAYLLSLALFLFLHFTPLFDHAGLSRLLPPRKDPTKAGIGWSELGSVVSELRKGEEKIISPHYQISAELAFYVKGNPRTYCINLGRRMNQYDLWKKDYEGNAIFVDYVPINHRVLSASDGIMEEREIPIVWRGQEIRRFYIYKLKNLKRVEESMLGHY